MLDLDWAYQLVAWTPFLLQGFSWNLLIAVAAVLLGTGLGAALVTLGQARTGSIAAASRFLSKLVNHVPTFALMFYCAILLPHEFELPWTDELVTFPLWIKASLALAASPAGFTAQNLQPSLDRWRRQEYSAALLFVPSWGMTLMVTVVASSTASLVGVDEVISRANKLIAASQNTHLMVPIYLYVSLFFVGVCTLIMGLMTLLRRRLLRGERT